jgi:hypothetical protein
MLEDNRRGLLAQLPHSLRLQDEAYLLFNPSESDLLPQKLQNTAEKQESLKKNHDLVITPNQTTIDRSLC